MRQLTTRQAQILEFIRAHVAERGYPPTLREIGAAFGIRSTNGVSDHLVALERKGYLALHPSRSRGIRVVNAPVREVAVDPSLLGGDVRDVFFLLAPDDSLRHRGVLEGDVLFFGPSPPIGGPAGPCAVRVGGRAVVFACPPEGADVMGHLLGVFRSFSPPRLEVIDTPSGTHPVSSASPVPSP